MLKAIRRVSGELRRDIAAVRQRDPAAAEVSTAEILTQWPGLHALLMHRVAHALVMAEVPVLPRGIAYFSRALTGIEIHPRARIGDGMFIDHGIGVVIGHGAKIGANTVVIHDAPPNSTVVGNPGHPVRVEGRKPEGPDADWVHLPDPIADALKQMAARIADLEREVATLRGEDPGKVAAVVPLRPARGPSPAGG